MQMLLYLAMKTLKHVERNKNKVSCMSCVLLQLISLGKLAEVHVYVQQATSPFSYVETYFFSPVIALENGLVRLSM